MPKSLVATVKKAMAGTEKPLLYYHDNGAWILYSRSLTKEEEDTGDVDQRIIIAEGGEDSFGYVPDIVEALCKAVGIKVDSI